MAKIRSNLHTGQYAGGVPSDHGQRQALVEPLSLPVHQWDIHIHTTVILNCGSWVIITSSRFVWINIVLAIAMRLF